MHLCVLYISLVLIKVKRNYVELWCGSYDPRPFLRLMWSRWFLKALDDYQLSYEFIIYNILSLSNPKLWNFHETDWYSYE
jgi:hypothetical protein